MAKATRLDRQKPGLEDLARGVGCERSASSATGDRHHQRCGARLVGQSAAASQQHHRALRASSRPQSPCRPARGGGVTSARNNALPTFQPRRTGFSSRVNGVGEPSTQRGAQPASRQSGQTQSRSKGTADRAAGEELAIAWHTRRRIAHGRGPTRPAAGNGRARSGASKMMRRP